MDHRQKCRDANPSLIQKMMQHKYYVPAEIYVEEVQQLFEGAEGAVTQL